MFKKFRVKDGKDFKLKDYSTKRDNSLNKKEIISVDMPKKLEEMAAYQDKLYADGKEGILIIIQAMDTAGKDGLIKHVMTTFNPQGVTVAAFKQPSKEEMAHDFLWRSMKHLPKRGDIEIFNRSYYEDVVVTRVHSLLQERNLPDYMKEGDEVFEKRYRDIRNFEKYLTDNGIHIVKFFLNLSKDEQKERLLARIDDKNKNWKFSASDIAERAYWDDYQKYYEKMIQETATDYAPWYVLPADSKWFARYIASLVIVNEFEKIDPKYPKLDDEDMANLDKWKQQLLDEK